MAQLVSLYEASEHLRRDTDYDDADLKAKIIAASAMVLSHLGLAEDYYTDSNDESTAPAVVKLAVCIIVAEFYVNRDGGEGGFVDGRLPGNVRAMLGPYRDPIMA